MVLPPCLLKLCVSAKFLPLRVISLPYNMQRGTNEMGVCQLAFLALLNGFSGSRWGGGGAAGSYQTKVDFLSKLKKSFIRSTSIQVVILDLN